MKTILMITAVALVSGCGVDVDLSPEAGWTGGAPQTRQEFALAAMSEMLGRERANVKLELARKKYQWGR